MNSLRLISRFVFILGIMAILTQGTASQTFDPNALTFTIHLDKNTYLENEAIWVTVSLKNTSKVQVYAGSLEPLCGFLKFYILSSKGDTLPGPLVQGDCWFPEGKYPSLESGEKDMEIMNILSHYGIYNKDCDCIWGGVITEGKYTIQAKLKDLYHKKKSEKMDIFSNKLSLEVKKSTSKEKEVLDLLVSAKREQIKGNSSSAIDIYKKVIKEYPQSVYADNAYFFLPTTYFSNNELAYDFLQKYPNSGLAPEVIEDLTIRREGREKAQKSLEKLISQYPNTKISEYSRVLIEKLKRGKVIASEETK
ncbi:MAG: tetratricopeptide repeat protein [candidate division Zixibacteria bacterium]|nr:tetratricopeptide repeat protein [candidate division Zixibacteria bacterium]